MICESEVMLKSLALGLHGDILWSKGICSERQQLDKSPHGVQTLVVVAADESPIERTLSLMKTERSGAVEECAEHRIERRI